MDASGVGHNYCLQCIAAQQNRNAECPLCRAAFDAERPLSVNTGLRDLITLANTLHTVEQDGWETVTATRIPSEVPPTYVLPSNAVQPCLIQLLSGSGNSERQLLSTWC